MNGKRIALALLVMIMAALVALYALFMLGILHVDSRPWMNSKPTGHGRFVDFMSRAGVNLREYRLYRGGAIQGTVYIGDPDHIKDDLKIFDTGDNAAGTSKKGSGVASGDEENRLRDLIILPRFSSSVIGDSGLLKMDWEFKILDWKMELSTADTPISSYTDGVGTSYNIDPPLIPIRVNGKAPGKNLLVELGEADGYRVYVFAVANIPENRFLAGEGSFQLLYGNLKDSMTTGTWLMYFSPWCYEGQLSQSLDQPMKILFAGRTLLATLSVLGFFLLLIWRSMIRFGLPEGGALREVRMLDSHLKNTAVFWQRHAGPSAADNADMDRFWRELAEIRPEFDRIDKSDKRELLLKRYPELQTRSELFYGNRKGITLRQLQHRMRSREEILGKIQSYGER